jgi:hypothetical protein
MEPAPTQYHQVLTCRWISANAGLDCIWVDEQRPQTAERDQRGVDHLLDEVRRTGHGPVVAPTSRAA